MSGSPAHHNLFSYDDGAGLVDQVAQYLPPHPANGRGAGRWVARQMTTRLDMISTSRGLTTRLWV